MLNTLPVQASVRQPRGVVEINGAKVRGWKSWTVTNNTYYQADTFEVEFAASALPAGNDPSWFSGQPRMYVEIFAGFPSNPLEPNKAELTSLVYGRVDDVRYNPVSATIRLTGRDLSAAFIDSRVTTENYTNQRSSDIALALAAEHGMQANVTTTTGLVGLLYQHNQTHLMTNRTEWDLLAFLARSSLFVCYVTGQTLYFGPDPIPTADAYAIQWSLPTADRSYPVSNVIDIEFSRSLTVGGGISVTARSASLKSKKAVSQSYPTAPRSTSPGKATPFGPLQNYYFTMAPGFSPQQVALYAQQKYDEIVAHEMKLRATLPGDVVLTPRMVLKVTGTGTDFDQVYYPRVVTRSMSIDEFAMEVEAQNQNPDTVAPGAGAADENPGTSEAASGDE